MSILEELASLLVCDTPDRLDMLQLKNKKLTSYFYIKGPFVSCVWTAPS